MREEDKKKMTFINKFGTYEFNVMPFGLCNALATFQRLMDEVLHEFKDKFMVVYLDDITVYLETFNDHVRHLTEVFWRGQVIKSQELHRKINLRQLRAFLGLASYYRRFIKDFSKIVWPLYDLLKKNKAYEWGKEQREAFKILKQKLVIAPILRYPNFSKPFYLHTDASGTGLGAVLAQTSEDKKEYAVAYASRSLMGAERNYHMTELECLAVVWVVEHWTTPPLNGSGLRCWKANVRGGCYV